MQRSKAAPQPGGAAVDVSRAQRRGYGLSTFSPLGNRDYRLLWFGTLLSSAGQWIQQVSLGWLTYDITGSAFLLGVVNGFRALPILLLGPFGGVAADRVERRRLMLITHAYMVVVTAGFATIVVTGHAHVWNLIVFTMLSGVGWAFAMPVRQSVIPNLVSREDLPKAIALNSAGINLTRVVGPSLAGLLIALVGVGENFYVQASAYLGIAFLVWRMRVPAVPKTPRSASVFRNVSEGAEYVWHDPFLRAQMGLALIPTLVALPFTSLMPIFAQDVLGVGPVGFGVLMAAPGFGAVLGIVALSSLGNVQRRGRLLLGSLICLGIMLVLFSFSRSYPLSLFLLLVSGAFQFIYLATNQTLLQLATPDGFRGRVMGIYMLNQGLVPLGSLLAGGMAAVVGAPSAVFIMGVSLLSLCALAFIAMAPIRALYNRAT